MARTYNRDSRGRFAGGGGSSGGSGSSGGKAKAKPKASAKPKAKAKTAAGGGRKRNKSFVTTTGTFATRLKAKQAQKARTKRFSSKATGPGRDAKAEYKKRAGEARKAAKAAATQAKPAPKLSRDQRIQANEARGKEVRQTADVFRSRLSKKDRPATGEKTLGGYIARIAGRPLGFAASNRVMDQIEKITGVGQSKLQGVRVSIDNASRTVTYSLTPVAKRQAAIAEKVASRKPRRRKPKS